MIYVPKTAMALNIPDAEMVSKKQINRFSAFKANNHAYPHYHNFFEILYVEKGVITHSINAGESEIMKEGDFVFIDIGTIHEYTGGSDNLLNIIFTPQLFDPNMQDCASIAELFNNRNFNTLEPFFITMPINTIIHDTDGTALNMIKFLKAKSENPQSLSYNIIQYCLLSLLMHITEPLYSGDKQINKITEALLEIVEEHYTEQNLLSYAAKKLNYTVPHISATFKNDYGMSFKEYLQFYRITKAKKLLTTTNMSVTEVGSTVGYSNIKFFRSIFKKYTNMTPTQYKASPAMDYSINKSIRKP